MKIHKVFNHRNSTVKKNSTPGWEVRGGNSLPCSAPHLPTSPSPAASKSVGGYRNIPKCHPTACSPERQKLHKLVITGWAGVACAWWCSPRDGGLLAGEGAGAWEGWPRRWGGLRGLIPAGLGMMGVPGGPPPPGGPCGETKWGSATQTRASPTSPRFQMRCWTWHPQTQPGFPHGTDSLPNHRSSLSHNISAPQQQDGQMEHTHHVCTRR